MNRLVKLIVVGAMATVLAGCGQQAPKQTDIKPEAATTSEPAAQPAAEPETVKPAADEQGAETPAAAPSQE
jgi:type IV pilus biogenesis protein CpaD/CtpE